MCYLLSLRSRFVWVGSAMLSLPYQWPSIMKLRKLVTTWTMLVWIISLIVAIPFALHVDCLSTFDYTSDHKMEKLPMDGACSCVFTVSQSEVANMFGSSLVVLSLVLVVAIAGITCRKRQSPEEETADLKQNTSPKTLGRIRGSSKQAAMLNHNLVDLSLCYWLRINKVSDSLIFPYAP